MSRGLLLVLMSLVQACATVRSPVASPPTPAVAPPSRVRPIVVQLIPAGSEVSAHYDESHVAFAGVRVEIEGDRVLVAEAHLDQPIVGVGHDQEAWYFVTPGGAVYSSSTFRGALVLMGQFDPPAVFGAGSAVSVIDGNGRVYRPRHGGFDRVAGLDDYLVSAARFTAEGGEVSAMGGMNLATRDGTHWYQSDVTLSDSVNPLPASVRARVERHVRTQFRASLLNRSEYRYLGEGVFVSGERIVSPSGERTVPGPPVVYFDRLYRLSDGLLGVGFDLTDDGWQRLRVDTGLWEPVDFPVTEISPLEDDRTITDGRTMLWQCEQDVVCWLRFDDLQFTKVPIMNWLDHRTIAMGGRHAFVYSDAGRADIIDLESGLRRPVAMPGEVPVDVAATLLDGALLVETGEEHEVAYRLSIDGSVRTIRLPEPVSAIDFSPHAPIGVALPVRGSATLVTQDEGRTWREAALPVSAILDPSDVQCSFETCRSGNVVLSLEGTFPEPRGSIDLVQTPVGQPGPTRAVEWECEHQPIGTYPSFGTVEAVGDEIRLSYRVGGRLVRRTAQPPVGATAVEYVLGPSSTGVAWVHKSPSDDGDERPEFIDFFVTRAGTRELPNTGVLWAQPASDGSLFVFVETRSGPQIVRLMPDGSEQPLPLADHMFIEGDRVAPAFSMGNRISVPLPRTGQGSGSRAYDVNVATALVNACPPERAETDAPLLIVARGPIRGDRSVAGIRLGSSPCTEFAQTRLHRVESNGQGWSSPTSACGVDRRSMSPVR